MEVLSAVIRATDESCRIFHLKYQRGGFFFADINCCSSTMVVLKSCGAVPRLRPLVLGLSP